MNSGSVQLKVEQLNAMKVGRFRKQALGLALTSCMAASAGFVSTGAAAASIAGTDVSIGGFIKADAMWSDFSDGDRAAATVGDDLIVPSVIPVGAGGNDANQFDTHVKHSRFNIKTITNTDAGKVKGFFEMDFNGGADERLTNQASNGLRHAFLAWDYSDKGNLLVGQTWSTFFNVGALPEAVDFVGPTSGTVFVRQSQLRWTKKLSSGSFMLAAENPSTSLNDGGAGLSNNQYDNNTIPDVVLRYNGKAGGLSYTAAMIARQIAYRDGGNDETNNGVGFSLSGKWAFKNGDDLKFMVNHGVLGRYVALNAFRDGVIEADGSIATVDVTGGFIAYKHKWSRKLRSTISYATTSVDNATTSVGDLTETVSNASINLLYSPTKKLTFGGEYIVADRETEAGVDGDLTRVQLMAKWAF